MQLETDQVLDEETVVDESEEEAQEDAEGSETAGADDASAEATDDAAEGQDEVEITIGDDKPEPAATEKAPSWVADLRKRNRELAKALREAQAAQLQPAATAQEEPIGPKPAMSDADVDFDADKFEAKLLAWNERKRKAEDAKREREQAAQANAEAWRQTLGKYESELKAIKAPGVEEAEEAVKDAFSVVQHGIIIQGAENRAQIVYALGRNPKRLQELAAIKDPVKFAIEIGKVSALMKVTTRKPTTAPETGVRGGSPGVTSTATRQDALLKKAQTTGDYTEYFKAQRAARAAKKS